MSTQAPEETLNKIQTETIPEATIRFCGDSGDGMQLTGSQFTSTTGVAGNDLMTFPDFPAEIRAPQGTLAGVSGFQIHFSSYDIHTPGDEVDVLVAMNPAALKSNLASLKKQGTLIANTDAFDERNLAKVQYESDPLEDEKLKERYHLIKAPITKLTRSALEELGLAKNEVDRCKNFFALGITYWLFQRDQETTLNWIENKFKKRPELVKANQLALKAGFNFAETCELFPYRYEVNKAQLPAGTYRNITGGSAVALGLVAAGQLADLKVMYGSYPITPASDILHELSRYKNFGVRTYQAEDEIAAVCAAIGASYGGALGVTASSGPGIALKMEAIGLANIVELPLIIIDAQRGGPSTGLPTKTEQSDLLQVMYGRNGESPLPIVSCSTPGDCFSATIEAARIALKYMTPVMLLTDGYITMGSEPWKLPEVDSLEKLTHNLVSKGEDGSDYLVYERDPETLARRWAVPGTPGFEHRVGGIEKDHKTGNVSYDPENHQQMVLTRAEKVSRIANDIAPAEVYGDDSGDVLLLAWGSTYGAVRSTIEKCRAEGLSVSHLHLRHINPFPANLGEVLNKFKHVLIPELNNGQLVVLLRNQFDREFTQLNKIKGRPFLIAEIKEKIQSLLS